MKLKNSLEFPDYTLRRLVTWCCKQLDMPVRGVKSATFRRSTKSFSGRARCWRGEIIVRLGEARHFPNSGSYGITAGGFADRIEGLIGVTAHEVAHLYQHHELRNNANAPRRGVGRERSTIWHEQLCLEAFRSSRTSLLAEWMDAPPQAVAESQPSLIDRRAIKAQRMLAAWQRRLKLAKGKVQKYQRRVKYYTAKMQPIPA